MKLYLSVIGISMTIISIINILFDIASWYYVIISVFFCTALAFCLDGGIAILINKLPNSWFSAKNRHFEVSKWEMELYKRLRVRLWKDKVWELGGLGGFSKKSMASTNDPEYIKKFIVECNRGVATHRLSYPVGFVAMLTLKGTCVFTVALPVALVNLYLNILPTLVLRYNTPKLKTLYERLLKKNGTVSVS